VRQDGSSASEAKRWTEGKAMEPSCLMQRNTIEPSEAIEKASKMSCLVLAKLTDIFIFETSYWFCIIITEYNK
jgi:hypothetical protein